MKKERKGRGRLSTLDTLPEEALPDLQWLKHELRDTRRTQVELRDIFNARLAVHGIPPISVGAFSRFSVNKATEFHELDRRLRLNRELGKMFDANSTDQLTKALGTKLQVQAFVLLENEGDTLSAKDLLELSRAVQALGSANKLVDDNRRSQDRENAQKLEAAKKDVEGIGKANGVSDDIMRKITQRLTGI